MHQHKTQYTAFLIGNCVKLPSCTHPVRIRPLPLSLSTTPKFTSASLDSMVLENCCKSAEKKLCECMSFMDKHFLITRSPSIAWNKHQLHMNFFSAV